MFTGFNQDTIDFLWGVRFNNERPWFEANKQRYLDNVLAPTRALGEELYDYMAEKYPELWLNLKVSRIYRDARRLFGRGPYKDHLWFSLRHDNDAWPCRPEFFFEVNPDGCSYGMGFWNATPQVMEKFRRQLIGQPEGFEALAKAYAAQQDFPLWGEEYKRDKGAPSPLVAPWFNRKRIALWKDIPYDVVFSHDLVEQMKAGYDFLVPYYRYFAALCPEE